jgi:hypothetical protein
LSDEDFWKLSIESSEPDGFYRSDNLTSNELLYQRVIPDLVKRVHRNGVYLGVGPEQNFTYIAALHPSLAVIFDIRRRNLQLHLMYKALFELARDRADFVSMLFSKPRPENTRDDASVVELFAPFARVPTDERLYERTLSAIKHHLINTRHLPLPDADLQGIEYVYHAFFFNQAFVVPRGPRVKYADMMAQTDGLGTYRSYLASEENFRTLKQLEARNLLVPVVADFAGPRSIRAIAAYLKAHGAVVSAFYLSNVEEYLPSDNWLTFCSNVAALPFDRASTFIRSTSRPGTEGSGLASSLGSMSEDTQRCRVN